VLAAFSVTSLGVGVERRRDRGRGGTGGPGSGLANRTDAMFTLVEGEGGDEVMGVVKHAVEAVGRHVPRVSTVVKVGWRASVTDAMTGKVESVERHPGAPAIG
jgi:Thiamine-binding protein